MKIKLDFENIEDYIITIENTIEDYEDYQKTIKTKMQYIIDQGSGLFFIELKEELGIRIENISKINEYLEELKNRLENFISDYKEYDDSVVNGKYLFDTEEVETKKYKIKNFFENINYLNQNFEQTKEYEEYDNKKRIFLNNEESNWQLRNIYSEDIETAEYLIQKKDKIEEYLANEKYNLKIITEVEDLLRKEKR